jgi:uncharacterized low-complexity protein
MRAIVAVASAVVLALAAVGCTKSEPKATREQVLPLLQQEAARVKAEGEAVPDVGVKASWTIAAVDVQEQPGNDAQPFKGTIRIRIESATHALEGPATQAFEKKFDYVYDAVQKKWLFRL